MKKFIKIVRSIIRDLFTVTKETLIVFNRIISAILAQPGLTFRLGSALCIICAFIYRVIEAG